MNYNELLRSIEHWNEYRVPILRISNPDKNLNFQGAMRFYFQDSGQKVATKCVNVTSNDTTKDVIDVLIEKFRPDMRMLSVPEYGLYEIHENGDERKLGQDEKPIFVQLEWNQDDREGRFLLRRMDEKTRDIISQNEEPSLKRKLSKKEKKKQEKIKKQQQKDQEKADAVANKLASKKKNGIAERLYNELPETSFTRSISNPEAVMKRRRAQKLEKRLQELSSDGGQEAGGTLRIFGEAINKDVSYKTLLLSTKDTASSVVRQILEKYGKENEDSNNYCLVQLIVPPSATSTGSDNQSVHDINPSATLRESILDDQDCPLSINQNHDKSKGILTFHIRQKPADYQKRRKKKPSKAQVQQNHLHPLVVQQLNQRLQINNNNSEQYSNQNSPQTSSQTSGSMNHDTSIPPHLPGMYAVQPNPGLWNVYYNNHQPQDSPEIIVIQLRKRNNFIGLSIIAARGIGQERIGIYIKNVVKDGAAALDGRLQAGDQLLEVDGNSLLDVDQEIAADLMQKTGSIVTLRIAKQAAIYHNLSDIINSVPSQTAMSPPAVQFPQTMVPQVPMQQIPLPEWKLLPHPHPHQHPHPHPMMHQSVQAVPMERQHPQLHPPDLSNNFRIVQYQPEDYAHQLQQERLINIHQSEQHQQPIPSRQVHFQPPPPTIMPEAETSPNSISVTSPLKSPKKVSWVDTQPHQSLHTLIPPSPSLAPSPPAEDAHNDNKWLYFPDEFLNKLAEEYSRNNINATDNDNHNDMLDITNGQQHTNNEENELHHSMQYPNNSQLQQLDHLESINETEVVGKSPKSNGQLETTTESLTLEDIDEVLSSKAHNNWLEDSAGVIGTQEVYNDPRQRIVRERERSNADINIEKLSFQEKLKMFNISTKK